MVPTDVPRSTSRVGGSTPTSVASPREARRTAGSSYVFGTATPDITKVVVHFVNGPAVETTTFTAQLPGSFGPVRLWMVARNGPLPVASFTAESTAPGGPIQIEGSPDAFTNYPPC